MDQWIAWACNIFLDKPIAVSLVGDLVSHSWGCSCSQKWIQCTSLHPKFLGPISQLEGDYVSPWWSKPVTTAAPVRFFLSIRGLGHCSAEGFLMPLCSKKQRGYHDYHMIIIWLSYDYHMIIMGIFQMQKKQRHLYYWIYWFPPIFNNEKWNIVKLSKSSHQESASLCFLPHLPGEGC